MASSTQIRPRGQLVGPVTTAGAACAVLGAVAYAVGWRLGWIELLVLAAACFVALIVAVPFILGRSNLDVRRDVANDRITVGEALEVELHVTNPGRVPSRRVDVEEHVGDRVEVLAIPVMAPGTSSDHRYQMLPDRRSRLIVGPAVISRADPLRLLRRQVAQSDHTVCWVYPRTTHLGPLPVGFAKDLEGPTSDASPQGDVAFHAVRPYVIGDDRRHIHWLSTAKTGSLMVRHYVDNRRPHVAVLLDTDPSAYTDESFETAVSIASSLATSMIRAQLPISLRIGNVTVAGTGVPATVDSALESLTVCERSPLGADDLTVSAAEFLRLEQGPSALVLITGARSDVDLLGAVTYARRRVRPIVVPVSPHDDDPGHDQLVERHGLGVVALPGAQTLPVTTLDGFRSRWGILAR